MLGLKQLYLVPAYMLPMSIVRSAPKGDHVPGSSTLVPSVHDPSVMWSPRAPHEAHVLGPQPRLCTCVGNTRAFVPESTEVPGYSGGSGNNEPHSPASSGLSPTYRHSPVKLIAAKMGAKEEFAGFPCVFLNQGPTPLERKRHSPCAVYLPIRRMHLSHGNL